MLNPRLALVSLSVAASTGCFLFTDFTVPGDGDGGATASTSTTADTVTSSSSSSSSTGGCTPAPNDPENCGACGWGCGPDSVCEDGVCSAVQSGTLDFATTLAVLEPLPGPDRSVPQVFSARSQESGMGPVTIERWSGSFAALEPADGTTNVADKGAGRLFASQSVELPTELVYGPQDVMGCAGGAPCLDHCTTGLACTRVQLERPGSLGPHVNGAVIHGKLTAYITDVDKRVYVVPTDCLTQTPPSCAPKHFVEGMLGANGPSTSAYLGLLDRDPIDGRLWWTTVDYGGTDDACVYRSDILPTVASQGDCMSCTVSCAIPKSALPDVWGVVVSKLGIFVGTKVPPSEFADGPIFTVDRDTLAVAPLAHATARFPADADDALLYAFDDATSPGRLVAIDPRSGIVVASAPLPDAAEGLLLDVDATSRDWVYFTSEKHLYRWRKPAAAYSQSMP